MAVGKRKNRVHKKRKKKLQPLVPPFLRYTRLHSWQSLVARAEYLGMPPLTKSDVSRGDTIYRYGSWSGSLHREHKNRGSTFERNVLRAMNEEAVRLGAQQERDK